MEDNYQTNVNEGLQGEAPGRTEAVGQEKAELEIAKINETIKQCEIDQFFACFAGLENTLADRPGLHLYPIHKHKLTEAMNILGEALPIQRKDKRVEEHKVELCKALQIRMSDLPLMLNALNLFKDRITSKPLTDKGFLGLGYLWKEGAKERPGKLFLLTSTPENKDQQ